MTKEYHEIFIPFTDVYMLGGPTVFKHLERKKDNKKNLVVYPSNFDDILEPEERRYQSFSSEGGKDVIRFLKKIKDKKLSKEDASAFLKTGSEENLLNGVAVYRFSEGLDVAYIDYENFTKKEFDIGTLEEEVKKRWKIMNDEKPELLTSKAKFHTKYDSRGMRVKDPNFLLVNADIVNSGLINGNSELLNELYSNNRSVPAKIASEIIGEPLYMNQFIKFASSENKRFVYGRVTGNLEWNKSKSRIINIDGMALELLKENEYSKKLNIKNHQFDNVLGIKPLDMEQYLALNHGILDTEKEIFFLCGSQGSGKTLLGYTGAVDLILSYSQATRVKRGLSKDSKGGFFKQIVLLKPNDSLGGKKREVGHLPGDLYSKIRPTLDPYIDSHNESILGERFPFKEMILHPKYANDYGDRRNKDIKLPNDAYLPIKNEAIELTTSSFLRGRSFKDTLVLLDEAQNFTPYEAKTILERLGPGSAALVMGDPWQHDNPDCSREINGLTHAIKHYLPKPYSGLINLTRNYRHQISEDSKDWKVYSS